MPSRAEAGTRFLAWPRVNFTGCPLTSWSCAEVSAASVSGRNGSLVSSRATPAEMSERMPFSTVGRNCCSRGGRTATAWSMASFTCGFAITVVVTWLLTRVSTWGRSTIVFTLDTKTCVLITLRRVQSEVLASTSARALTMISRPARKRRMVHGPHDGTPGSSPRADDAVAAAGDDGRAHDADDRHRDRYRRARADRGPADRCAGHDGRVDRLVLLPPVRLTERLRRSPGRRARGALPDPAGGHGVHVQADVPARHRRPGDPLLHRRRPRPGRRLHAARRIGGDREPPARAARGGHPWAHDGRDGGRAPGRLQPAAAPDGAQRARGCVHRERSPAHHARRARAGRRTPRPGHRGRRRPGDAAARRRAVPRSGPRDGRGGAPSRVPARRGAADVRRDGRVLAVLGRPVDLSRPVAGGHPALGHHPEADDLRTERRARRRPHGSPARAGRRGAELGLPLHLGARRVLLGLRADALGFHDEATQFGRWLGDRIRERVGSDSGPLNIMYRIDGSSDLKEDSLDHWRGYRGSSPVRIGNGAAEQLQLDIYGEAMDSIFAGVQGGMPLPHQGWTAITGVLDWLAENWDQPEEGIWETRGGRHPFTYGRVMCWVAF